MNVVAEVIILVRQSGNGFYLTGSGKLLVASVVALLMVIAVRGLFR